MRSGSLTLVASGVATKDTASAMLSTVSVSAQKYELIMSCILSYCCSSDKQYIIPNIQAARVASYGRCCERHLYWSMFPSEPPQRGLIYLAAART